MAPLVPQESIIYTNVSSILISVNPFKLLPLYTPEIMDKYRTNSREQPPHVFQVKRKKTTLQCPSPPPPCGGTPPPPPSAHTAAPEIHSLLQTHFPTHFPLGNHRRPPQPSPLPR